MSSSSEKSDKQTPDQKFENEENNFELDFNPDWKELNHDSKMFNENSQILSCISADKNVHDLNHNFDDNVDNKNQSLDLGSNYDKNEYMFDDKVSSVQRDLSLDNSTNEYNSQLMDLTENEDNVDNLKNYVNGGLTKMKSKGMLHSSSSKGMARIKSSTKLFTIHRNIAPLDEDEKELGGHLIQGNDVSASYESENVSDLSTGDSAYPVVAFNNRCIKEFEPKITMKVINDHQRSLINYISKVPNHTKLKYESPMHSKWINSPPQQNSLSDLSDPATPHSQFEEKKFQYNPRCFKNYANRSSSDSFNNSSIDEGFAKS